LRLHPAVKRAARPNVASVWKRTAMLTPFFLAAANGRHRPQWLTGLTALLARPTPFVTKADNQRWLT
jgi:hypothetical protein